MSRSIHPPSRRTLTWLVGAWLSLCVAGSATLWWYTNSPGSAPASIARWPEDVSLGRDASTATLVMLAHPRCPCTRASLRELDTLLAQVGDRVRTHVLFLLPETVPGDWLETDLYRSAASLPGVEVHADPGGRLAKRFGATTSGHVVLFGSDGTAWFSGGITAGRGHEGDNVGRLALTSLLRGKQTEVAATQVYGCALEGAEALAHGENGSGRHNLGAEREFGD